MRRSRSVLPGRPTSAARSLPAVLAASLLAAGCGFFGRVVVSEAGPERPDAVRVEVVNWNGSDATVNLLGRGGTLLGQVRSDRLETYTVDLAEPTELRFHVSLAEGGRCTTRALDAAPGGTLRLSIGRTLGGTSPHCR